MKLINENNYITILNSKGNIIRNSSSKYTYDTTKWVKSLQEAVYCYKNNIISQPLCVCGEGVNFIGTTKGYSEFCSCKCSRSFQGNTPEPEKTPLTIDNINEVFSKSGKISYVKIKKYKIPDNIYWPSNIKGYVKCLQNGISEHPTCKECGCYLPYIDNSTDKTTTGYRMFCSNVCSNKNLDVSLKKAKTFCENIGVNLHKRPKNTTQIYKGHQIEGYIYLIHSKKLSKVKIGISINPEERLKRIQRSVEDATIVLTKKLPNVFIYEKQLQETFKNDHAPLDEGDGKTEWFTDDNIDIMKNIISKIEV